MEFTCWVCDKRISRKDNVARHYGSLEHRWAMFFKGLGPRPTQCLPTATQRRRVANSLVAVTSRYEPVPLLRTQHQRRGSTVRAQSLTTSHQPSPSTHYHHPSTVSHQHPPAARCQPSTTVTHQQPPPARIQLPPSVTVTLTKQPIIQPPVVSRRSSPPATADAVSISITPVGSAQSATHLPQPLPAATVTMSQLPPLTPSTPQQPSTSLPFPLTNNHETPSTSSETIPSAVPAAPQRSNRRDVPGLIPIFPPMNFPPTTLLSNTETKTKNSSVPAPTVTKEINVEIPAQIDPINLSDPLSSPSLLFDLSPLSDIDLILNNTFGSSLFNRSPVDMSEVFLSIEEETNRLSTMEQLQRMLDDKETVGGNGGASMKRPSSEEGALTPKRAKLTESLAAGDASTLNPGETTSDLLDSMGPSTAIHVPNVRAVSPLLNCQHCNLNFYSYHGLNRHTKTYHNHVHDDNARIMIDNDDEIMLISESEQEEEEEEEVEVLFDSNVIDHDNDDDDHHDNDQRGHGSSGHGDGGASPPHSSSSSSSSSYSSSSSSYTSVYETDDSSSSGSSSGTNSSNNGSNSSSSSSSSSNSNNCNLSASPSINDSSIGGSVNSDDSDGDLIPNFVAPEGFEEVETAFRGRLKTYRMMNTPVEGITIPDFLVNVFERIVQLLHNILTHVRGIKTNMWLECEFKNVHGETCKKSFKTKNMIVLRATDLEEVCSVLFQKLLNEKESCEMKGSGWAFMRIIMLEVRINNYQPLGGSSFIPLPQDLIAKRAVINVKNEEDHMCFKYAILSRHIDNPAHRQLLARHFTPQVEADSQIDFSDLTYPVSLNQIPKFEEKNGVSINVYGVDNERVSGFGNQTKYRSVVYPLRVAKTEEEYPDHYDLLFLTNETTTHYALISDFSRLVRSQLTAHHNRVYICRRCMAHFNNNINIRGQNGADKLQEHKKYCKENAPLRTDLSEKLKTKFERHERKQRSRFVAYADFECALVPIDDHGNRIQPPTVPPPVGDLANDRSARPQNDNQRNQALGIDSNNVRTRYIHKPFSYAYLIYDSTATENPDAAYVQFRSYTGEDAAEHFMESLQQDVRAVGDILYAHRRLKPRLNRQERAAHEASTHCYLCRRPFADDGSDKVRDHQHSAPYQYRGAAHRACNIRYREQTLLNVYFHNLSNYDAHFVVRELGMDEGDVSVLANSEEKFISFTKHFFYPGAGRNNAIGVRFVDSYRFLSKPLSGLVSILPPEKLRNTRKYFPDDNKFDLMKRKGVFPYEHVSSIAVLSEEELPPQEAFHDSLHDEEIKDEEYAHAQRVWNEFNCRNLREYAELYVQTDVLLLADVYEAFRDMCLEHYELDPAHWITLPSYAWDVMLMKTDVTLDTLREVDQYQFFEKGIRGGLTQVVTRNAIADNKFTRGEEEGREDDSFLMYYDANNLYGWAMSQPLPTGEFRWLSQQETDNLRNQLETAPGIPDDNDIGYVLEVDLEYPRDHAVHDRHRDLPFCPELRKAPANELNYPQHILRDFGVGKSKKLMVTLMDKENYVIHYRLLQQALRNGLRLRNVHRVLQFRQSCWLEPYVRLNTELRQRARNKFEVELFKLMVNACYGMSLQNVRKHIDIRLSTNQETYTKLVAKSNFTDRTWYTENLALIQMGKTKVTLDKPVYVGMCILDHSKWWMYNFHYTMVDRYNTPDAGPDRIRLVYTDTDSLVYHIRTADVYRDMMAHAEDFDTSNYPQDHMCFSLQNARVLGKFKDESGSEIIKEFIGLMSKLYCVIYDIMKEDGTCSEPIKRAKGVNRSVVAKQLTVDDFRSCLFEQTVKNTVNERFTSRHHMMYTVSVTKRSLAPYDDKRYIMPEDGINTLPWGHYLIPRP